MDIDSFSVDASFSDPTDTQVSSSLAIETFVLAKNGIFGVDNQGNTTAVTAYTLGGNLTVTGAGYNYVFNTASGTNTGSLTLLPTLTQLQAQNSATSAIGTISLNGANGKIILSQFGATDHSQITIVDSTLILEAGVSSGDRNSIVLDDEAIDFVTPSGNTWHINGVAPTDGQVITGQADGTVAWEDQSGGGGSSLWVTDTDGINSNSQNIGIQTTSSNAYALNMQGDFNIRGGSGNTGFIRNSSNVINYQFGTSDGAIFDLKNASGTTTFRFRSAGDSYMNGGKLGIGTSTPAELLHVQGGIARVNNMTISYAGNDSYLQHQNVGNLWFRNIVNDAKMYFYVRNTTNNYSTGLEFNGNDEVIRLISGGTESMYFGASGQLRLSQYGSASYTGTPTYYLATDTNGDIIERSFAQVLADIGGGGSSHWEEDGDDIYRLSNVGVGIADPQNGLHSLDGFRIGNVGTSSARIFPFTGESYTSPNSAGYGMSFYSYLGSQTGTNYGIAFTGENRTSISGDQVSLLAASGFAPTSGDSNFSVFRITGTINQTGGANGITRGIHVLNALVSASDYRALEIGNNSGYGVYQSGASALNYFNGNVGIGTTTPTEKLEIAGNIKQSVTGNVNYKFGTGNLVFQSLNDQDIVIEDSGGNETARFATANQDFQFYSGQLFNGTVFANAIKKSTTGNSLQFGSTTATDWDAAYIPESVGIGIVAPNGAEVQIHENSAGASQIRLTNTDTGSTSTDGAEIGLASNEVLIINNRENNDLNLATNNTIRISIQEDGKVGIGTTTPDANSLLDVNGVIKSTNIPAPPTSDGTYTLTVTVTGGVPSYSWQ